MLVQPTVTVGLSCNSLLTSRFHRNRVGFCNNDFQSPNLKGLTPPNSENACFYFGKIKGLRELVTVRQGSRLTEAVLLTVSPAEAIREKRHWRIWNPKQRSDTPHCCSQVTVQHQACGPAYLQRDPVASDTPRQRKRTGNCWALMSLTLISEIQTLPCCRTVSTQQPRWFLCVRSCHPARNH